MILSVRPGTKCTVMGTAALERQDPKLEARLYVLQPKQPIGKLSYLSVVSASPAAQFFTHS